MKNKFKVGDIVRGTKESDEMYNITNSNVTKAKVVRVRDDRKISIKIIEHKHNVFVNSTFEVSPRFFEKVKLETIVIYRKDQSVIALDKTTGKTAEARCNPADTFCFMTGAKLAFERLTSTRELLNTKICITHINDDTALCDLTVGRTYKIKGGKFVDDKGDVFPLYDRLHNIEELRKYLSADVACGMAVYSSSKVDFVEVVE